MASGDFVLKLAQRIGGEVGAACRWSSLEEIVRDRGRSFATAHRGSAFVPAHRRGELRELESRGWWISSERPADEYWQQILAAGGWFDPFYDYDDRSGASQLPGGRIWLFPETARTRLAAGGGADPDGFLPAQHATDAGPNPDFPLQLIPYRVLTLASGGVVLMPWLLERLGVLSGAAWEAWVEVNPSTARELGLETGRRVRVESPEGAFEASLRLFAGAPPGTVNAPYGLHAAAPPGWGETIAANPLAAVGSRVDPVSQLPDWYSTRVRLVPV
jgi:anaerobic selenocysteine-containing dehydrogenase